MEDLIAFLVFLAIAASSVIAKLRSGKKESDKTPEEHEARKANQEKLPEVTRRMLFGDGEIIVAKPRRIQPPEQPASPKTVPVPPLANRPLLRESQPVRPTPVRTAPAKPASLQRRPAPPPAPRRPAAQASKIAARVAAPGKPEEGAPRPKPPAAPKPGVPRPSPVFEAAPRRFSLRSRSELARAIILREVLGPPRALEDLPML